MANLVFVHGWGFDQAFWDPVISHFEHFEVQRVDLGYTGDPNFIDEEAIYITHSMGLCWSLRNITRPKAIIAINGFTRFCSNRSDWPDAVAPAILKRMIRQFDKAPHQVWHDFMIQSGKTNADWPEKADVLEMAKGLVNLLELDGRDRWNELTIPKLVIASKKDKIVPEKLTRASFPEDIIWYTEGDHILPQSQPEKIAAQIKEFLDLSDRE